MASIRIAPSPDKELTLALAGVFQAASLVYQIAKLDRYDEGAFRDSAFSLIRLQAETVEQVFGSIPGVDLGLRTTVKLFSKKPDASTKDIYQYAVGVHQLSSKLNKLEKTSNLIHNELEVIQKEFSVDPNGSTESENIDFENLCESLANLYSRTVSYLTPRIIVQGSSDKLQRPENVMRVRTALFAGIRAAFLWHQLGGRRWQLIFNRSEYVNRARSLLNS